MPDADTDIDLSTVAEADAQYVPFPRFQDWSPERPAFLSWDSARTEFREVTPLASDENLREAQGIAIRAAAFDTGAIEGLYPTDRGLWGV